MSADSPTIECGKFNTRSETIDHNNMRRWAAPIKPVPDEVWRVAFKQEVLTAQKSPGTYLGRDLEVTDETIAFSAADNVAEAAANAIRNTVERANSTIARYRAQEHRHADVAAVTEQRRQDEAVESLRKLKEKYPEGL